MSLALAVACPAGHEVNPPGEGFAVVCGVIERENRDESGPQVRALVSMREEPRSVLSYCCAAGPLPVEERGEVRARSGYVHCPVWRAEVARRAKRERRVHADDANYGGVS